MIKKLIASFRTKTCAPISQRGLVWTHTLPASWGRSREKPCLPGQKGLGIRLRQFISSFSTLSSCKRWRLGCLIACLCSCVHGHWDGSTCHTASDSPPHWVWCFLLSWEKHCILWPGPLLVSSPDPVLSWEGSGDTSQGLCCVWSLSSTKINTALWFHWLPQVSWTNPKICMAMGSCHGYYVTSTHKFIISACVIRSIMGYSMSYQYVTVHLPEESVCSWEAHFLLHVHNPLWFLLHRYLHVPTPVQFPQFGLGSTQSRFATF